MKKLTIITAIVVLLFIIPFVFQSVLAVDDGFNVHVIPGKRCTENQRWCSDDMKQLKVCEFNSDGGSDWRLINCDFGCEFYGDSARCKSDSIAQNSSSSSNSSAIIIGISIIIGFIILAIILVKVLKKKK